MTRLMKLPVLSFVILLLAGCATTSGQRFGPETTIPTDKALIYVYRDSGFVGGAVAYTVRANGVDVAKLAAGGYFPYYATPGEVEFSAQTEAKTSVTIDAKAGQTYYIKGTIGVGVFVGHPHLVVVPNEVGAREIVACSLVPGANSTATEGGGRPSTPGGPMGNAVVDIDASDVVTLRSEPADVKLEVTDRRPKIVMERTALGKAMSGVVLRPTETELVKAIMITELREAVAAQAHSANGPWVACDITEFSITTPATLTHWDVTVNVVLTLRAGSQQRVLTGHAAQRTYVWPSEALIKAATVEALKAIAAQSGPALHELLTAPQAAAAAPST